MSKLIYLACAILLFSIVKVHSLQCYQCENCAKVNETQLVTCGQVVPSTTQSPTTTPGTGGNTEAPTTQNTAPTNPTAATEPTNAPNRDYLVSRMKRGAERIDVTYVCLTATYKVNETEVVNRGCQLDYEEFRLCAAPTKNVVCQYCDSDKCNSASGIKLSTVLITIAIAIKFACKL